MAEKRFKAHLKLLEKHIPVNKEWLTRVIKKEYLELLAEKKEAQSKELAKIEKDNNEEAITLPAKFLKTQEGEKRQLFYCVVLDPYDVDLDNDLPSPLEVEKAAHSYLAKSSVIKLFHKDTVDATVIENWVMPYPSLDDYKAAVTGDPHRIFKFRYGNSFVTSGSWVVGMKIEDKNIWKAVDEGILKAVSLGGSGTREEIKYGKAKPKVTEEIIIDYYKEKINE